jgi:hypothetical protein
LSFSGSYHRLLPSKFWFECTSWYSCFIHSF